MTTHKPGSTARPEALGRVTFIDGQNELPMLEISTAWSTAEIYLHGAHVTQFKKKDETPLLFLSQCSRFTEGKPIPLSSQKQTLLPMFHSISFINTQKSLTQRGIYLYFYTHR